MLHSYQVAGIKSPGITTHRKPTPRLTHADLERCRRHRADRISDGRVVHRGRDRNRWSTKSYQLANGRIDEIRDPIDRDGLAVKVEDVRAFERVVGTCDKRGGSIDRKSVV